MPKKITLSSLKTKCETAKKAFKNLSPELQIAVARSVWVIRLRAVWLFEYDIIKPDKATLSKFQDKAKEMVPTVAEARKHMKDYYENVLNNETKLKEWRKTA